jgi:hypothetical protein
MQFDPNVVVELESSSFDSDQQIETYEENSEFAEVSNQQFY